jgi:hypothetical protein
MKTPNALLLATIAIGALSGCASTEDAVKAKNEGVAKTHEVSSDQAWKITLTVLKWNGAYDIEEHRDKGYVTAEIEASLFSYGSVIAVWVEPEGQEKTRVTAVAKRRLQTNAFTGLSEDKFHEQFVRAAKILKSGSPLPEEPPE